MRRRAQRSSVLIPVETASKSAWSAMSGCGTSLFAMAGGSWDWRGWAQQRAVVSRARSRRSDSSLVMCKRALAPRRLSRPFCAPALISEALSVPLLRPTTWRDCTSRSPMPRRAMSRRRLRLMRAGRLGFNIFREVVRSGSISRLAGVRAEIEAAIRGLALV
jgi:hypothetical protein